MRKSMNDTELAQDLRDDAICLEVDMRWSVADRVRLAASRIEAGADLLAACELVMAEQATNAKTRDEFGGYVLDDYVAAVVSAAIAKAKGEQ